MYLPRHFVGLCRSRNLSFTRLCKMSSSKAEEVLFEEIGDKELLH